LLTGLLRRPGGCSSLCSELEKEKEKEKEINNKEFLFCIVSHPTKEEL